LIESLKHLLDSGIPFPFTHRFLWLDEKKRFFLWFDEKKGSSYGSLVF
jgi:hypothetical protein